jgi:hypothetical protein
MYQFCPETLEDDLKNYSDLLGKFWNARKKDYKQNLRKEIKKIKDKLLNPNDMFNRESSNNSIFQNAINWGIDFPEILDSNGNFRGFDAVITNPPYIRIQSLADAVKNYYESNFKVAKGSYELANLFVELVSRIVNSQAYSSFIMPHKFLNTANGTELRNVLEHASLDKLTVSKFIHFGANQIFNDVTTYTCIVDFDKSGNQSFQFQKFPYLKLKYDKLVECVTSRINEMTNYNIISISDIKQSYNLYGNNENNWILFNSNIEYGIFAKILSNKYSIKDISYKFMTGLQTSFDELYFAEVINETSTTLDLKLNFPKKSETILTNVEKKYFKKIFKGKDVHRYEDPETNRYVFFPYNIDKSEYPYKAELVTIDELKQYPKTYEYVMQFKDDFEKRENNRLKGISEFYKYIYPKNLGDFEQNKLMSMEISTGKTNFTIDYKNSYHTTTVYSLIKKRDCKFSYSCLLGILNSSLFWWFLYNTADTLSGDARRAMTKYINPFRLPVWSQDFDDTLSSLVKLRIAGDINIEQLIDLYVMKAYKLTFDEVVTVNPDYSKLDFSYYDDIYSKIQKVIAGAE